MRQDRGVERVVLQREAILGKELPVPVLAVPACRRVCNTEQRHEITIYGRCVEISRERSEESGGVGDGIGDDVEAARTLKKDKLSRKGSVFFSDKKVIGREWGGDWGLMEG